MSHNEPNRMTDSLKDDLRALEEASKAHLQATQLQMEMDEQRRIEIESMLKRHESLLPNMLINYKEATAHICEMIENLAQDIRRIAALVKTQTESRNEENR